MSVSMDNYPFECDFCNYEACFKSEKVWKMGMRLHKKKCPKTGRTEEGEVKRDVMRRMREFQQNNPNQATFLPQGRRAVHRNRAGLDGEIANLERDRGDSAIVQEQYNRDVASAMSADTSDMSNAELRRRIDVMKAIAYGEVEEGERGESPDSADCDDCECCCTQDASQLLDERFGKKFMAWLGEQTPDVREVMIKIAAAKYEASGESMDE